MSSVKTSFSAATLRLLPFWLFIILFKFGAGIHYSLLATIGARFLPLWEVGIVMGITAGIQLLLDVPAGFLIDRFGPLRMLRVGIVCFLAAAISLCFPLSLVSYGASALFSALGWLFFSPGITTYLLAVVPERIFGRVLSFQNTMEGLGITLALIGLTWFVHLPTVVIGLLIAYPLLGALLILLISRHFPNGPYPLPDVVHAKRQAHGAPWKTVRRALADLAPASWLLCAYSFTMATLLAMIWFTIPLLISRGVHPPLLSAGMIILESAALFIGFGLGKMVDRFPRRLMILVGLALCGIGGSLLGFSLFWLFLPLAFVLTTGDILAWLGLWTWVEEKDKKHDHDGVATGTITFAEDAGWMIGPILAGVLFPLLGTGKTFLLGTAPLFFIAFAVALVATGKKTKRPR